MKRIVTVILDAAWVAFTAALIMVALPVGIVLLLLFTLIDLVCRRDRRIAGGGRR